MVMRRFCDCAFLYKFICAVVCAVCVVFVSSLSAAEPFVMPAEIQTLFNRYCVECHGPQTAEAELRFDNTAKLGLDGRLVLLNAAQEQLYFGYMPPKEADQPTEAERNKLAAWLSNELRAHNASTLEDKLRMPEHGNVVDHSKLFSGKYKDLPGYTLDRRWLISEYIFDAKFNTLLGYNAQRDIDGKRQKCHRRQQSQNKSDDSVSAAYS